MLQALEDCMATSDSSDFPVIKVTMQPRMTQRCLNIRLYVVHLNGELYLLLLYPWQWCCSNHGGGLTGN